MQTIAIILAGGTLINQEAVMIQHHTQVENFFVPYDI